MAGNNAQPDSGFQGCWKGIDISGAGFAALFLAALSLLFMIISVATIHWAEADPDSTRIFSTNMGLFEYCERDVCSRYVDDEFPPSGQFDLNLVTRTEATASFAFIHLILVFIAIVQAIFGLGREGYGESVRSAAIALVFASLSGLVSMAIFAAVVDNLTSRFSPGYSFGLCTTAWVMSLVAAGLLYVDSNNITYLDASKAARAGGAGMI